MHHILTGPIFSLCLSYNLKLISHYLRWILTHTISNLSRPWWLLAEAEALYADARLYTYMQCQLLHTRLALFYYRRQQIYMPSTVNLCANVFFFSPFSWACGTDWRHFYIPVIMCKCRSETVSSSQASRDTPFWQTWDTECAGLGHRG